MNIAKINNDVCNQLQLGKFSDKANIRFVLQRRDKTLFAEGHYTECVGPPPNPAKVTDSRYGGYIDKYGHDCWELDALEPQVIVELIEKAVGDNTEPEKQHAILVKENEYKKQLREIAKSLNGEPDNENQNKSEGPADC